MSINSLPPLEDAAFTLFDAGFKYLAHLLGYATEDHQMNSAPDMAFIQGKGKCLEVRTCYLPDEERGSMDEVYRAEMNCRDDFIFTMLRPESYFSDLPVHYFTRMRKVFLPVMEIQAVQALAGKDDNTITLTCFARCDSPAAALRARLLRAKFIGSNCAALNRIRISLKELG